MKFFVLVFCLLLAVGFGNGESGEAHLDVVDGDDAFANQFPYQISLQKKLLLIFYEHRCGGSIISRNWVVTAAHCTNGTTKDQLRIVAGIVKLTDLLVTNEQKIGISEIITHPGYNGLSQWNVSADDVSLLKLASALNFGDNVQAINLPTAPATPGNATLSGWGYTSASKILPSNTLQFTTVLIESDEECESLAKSLIGDDNPYNSTAMICSTPQTNGTQAPCNGDSGGPLARNNTLLGIVSWTILPCGTANYPSVYTNVATYTSWIQENAV